MGKIHEEGYYSMTLFESTGWGMGVWNMPIRNQKTYLEEPIVALFNQTNTSNNSLLKYIQNFKKN